MPTRLTTLLAAGALALAGPVVAVSQSRPATPATPLAFQTLAARASAEARESFNLWLGRERRSGMRLGCVQAPADRAQFRRHASHVNAEAADYWLLGTLVGAQGGNAAPYVAKAGVLSREAAQEVLMLRRRCR
jgi:hypothetical protein